MSGERGNATSQEASGLDGTVVPTAASTSAKSKSGQMHEGDRLILNSDSCSRLAAALQSVEVPTSQRRVVKGRGICMGLTNTQRGHVVAHLHDSFRHLAVLINEMVNAALSDSFQAFSWTSIQLNKNTVSVPHRDSNNAGLSLVLLAGSFTGGAFHCESFKEPWQEQGKMLAFDGRAVHSSDPFSGTRFSVILFTHSSVAQCSEADLRNLTECGFRVSAGPAPRSGPRPFCLRVLYLFSGLSRRSSIKECLEKLVARTPDNRIKFLDVAEIDVLNDPVSHDLMDEDKRLSYLQEIRNGEWHIVVVTPPCSTFSRAVFANTNGPRPVRNRDYPMGFPWLSGWLKSKCEVGNVLGLFAASALAAVTDAKRAGFFARGLMEFPEDLGSAHLGTPASLWQLDAFRQITANDKGFVSFAFFQCKFGADFPKPTRLLTDLGSLAAAGYPGWPQLDERCAYGGPLPLGCGHSHKTRLVRPDGSGKTFLARSASYPERMNWWIAEAILEAAEAHCSHQGTVAPTLRGGSASWAHRSHHRSSLTTCLRAPLARRHGDHGVGRHRAHGGAGQCRDSLPHTYLSQGGPQARSGRRVHRQRGS